MDNMDQDPLPTQTLAPRTVTNVCITVAGFSPLMSSTAWHPLGAPGGSSHESSLSSPPGPAGSAPASLSPSPAAGVASSPSASSSGAGSAPAAPPLAAGEASTAGA